MRAILTLVLALFFSNAHAGLFGPSNYDDCVLENLKTAKTESAVASVHMACRNKFPEKKKNVDKVRCGKNLFDPTESANFSVPIPMSSPKRTFHIRTSRLIRTGDTLTVHLQSDLPYSIVSVRVAGFKESSDSIPLENYECSGVANEGSTGKFVCQNVHPSTRFFKITDATSDNINLLGAFRRMGFCD